MLEGLTLCLESAFFVCLKKDFNKWLFSQTLLLYQVVMRLVDCSERCSLSAGRAVSLLGVNTCMSLTCPAAPAGVSQSVPINLKQFSF
jgi:hypothetical protein